MLISAKLAHILCGGDRIQGTPITEQDVLDLEAEAFCSLCGTEKTQQRIQHMLQFQQAAAQLTRTAAFSLCVRSKAFTS